MISNFSFPLEDGVDFPETPRANSEEETHIEQDVGSQNDLFADAWHGDFPDDKGHDDKSDSDLDRFLQLENKDDVKDSVLKVKKSEPLFFLVQVQAWGQQLPQ